VPGAVSTTNNPSNELGTTRRTGRTGAHDTPDHSLLSGLGSAWRTVVTALLIRRFWVRSHRFASAFVGRLDHEGIALDLGTRRDGHRL